MNLTSHTIYSILVEGLVEDTRYTLQIISDFDDKNPRRSIKFGNPVDGSLDQNAK